LYLKMLELLAHLQKKKRDATSNSIKEAPVALALTAPWYLSSADLRTPIRIVWLAQFATHSSTPKEACHLCLTCSNSLP
jgi:hypothetical protein